MIAEDKLRLWMNRTYLSLNDSNGRNRNFSFAKIRSTGSKEYIDEVEKLLIEIGIKPSRFLVSQHVLQIKNKNDIDTLVKLAGPEFKKLKRYNELKEKQQNLGDMK